MKGLAYFCVLCLSASVASAGEYGHFDSGRWSGTALRDDSLSRFTSCTAATRLPDRTVITLTNTRDRTWELGLSNPGWHLPAGREYRLQLSFSPELAREVDATASTETELHVPLQGDMWTMSLIRLSRQMRVTSGSFDETYDLTGSADAVFAVAACVDAQMLAETAVAPQEGAPEPATKGDPVQVAALPPPAATAKVVRPGGGDALSTSTVNVVEVPLEAQSGVFYVPVQINGTITLDFIVDSGAADIAIPGDVYLTLVRSGTIEAGDILGKETYVTADGTQLEQQTFRIKSLKVGSTILHDLLAAIVPVEGDLLLGQGFLSRFKSWSMDNHRHVLRLEVE